MDRHDLPNWLQTLQEQIKSLRYGVVQVVVHDSRVIQIDRTERLRLPPLRSLAAEESRGGSFVAEQS